MPPNEIVLLNPVLEIPVTIDHANDMVYGVGTICFEVRRDGTAVGECALGTAEESFIGSGFLDWITGAPEFYFQPPKIVDEKAFTGDSVQGWRALAPGQLIDVDIQKVRVRFSDCAGNEVDPPLVSKAYTIITRKVDDDTLSKTYTCDSPFPFPR